MPDQSPASPLDDPDYRRKMSLPAFGAFADTAGYLRLDDEQASRLLAVPMMTYRRYLDEGADNLSKDELLRMSSLFGIVAALRTLFVDDETGVRWLHARNRGEIFAGQSPLRLMMEGSLAAFYRVRNYLDEWREGSFS